MERHTLLETDLKLLKLPTFVHNYRQFADDATKANQGYDAFLLALAEQELAQREANRQRQCIKAARLPLLKELADLIFRVYPVSTNNACWTWRAASISRKLSPFSWWGIRG